ncbi:peptidase [Duganella sp. LX20W]|uniref:Peptidase n=1 Tax=Rugamonas brunnea TaxID=2758569 RepID=A0A7W2IA01_9BURK|nr:CFI-box-CTERM domain-containing protein [Rugamonas brunnea]MBA5635714.1 peptidase [Rugamonas brunnea]
MVWAVTLVVHDCATNAGLQGALISDGYGGGGYTDSYGQFIALIDDYYSGYIAQISKSGYSSRNFTFDRSQIGTPQSTCLSVYVPPPPSSGGGGISCFIVTAASGSAQSKEVTGMRALRDQVAARAPLAGRLIDAIYDQYWRFSPALADQIAESEAARMGVMALVVRPLFAWFQLAGQLALAPDDTAAVRQAEKELRSACPRYLSPAKVASYLALLLRGEPLPAGAPGLVTQLEPQLRSALALPLVQWAIFEPLQRTWHGAAERLDMRSQVAAWLGAAPLDCVMSPTPQQLEEELASLASLVRFDPGARNRIGATLLAAWPGTDAALAQAGLLDAGA